MKRVLSCLLILLFLFLTPGCDTGGGAPSASPDASAKPKETATPTPSPQMGGELKVPLMAPDSFNPLLTQSRDILNFLNLIFEHPLVLDEKSRPAPSLVEKWEVSEDGRTWTFHVRKDVKWQNGQAMTGEDILFTFQALQSGKLGSLYEKDLAGNVNIVEAGLRNNDPYTFFVRLAEPSSEVLDIMTFPVLSKNVYQSPELMQKEKGNFSMTPIGTGPYQVDLSQPYNGTSMKLVRNEDWWNGKPYIDSILARVCQTNEEARAALGKGEIDLVDTMAVYANNYSDLDKITGYKYLTENYEFLALNCNNPLFADKNVRKAIAYAIDRTDIISRVYLNNAETVDVPMPSNSWLYDSAYRIYDYDEKRAAKLLKEAGWTDSDGDGVLDKIVEGEKQDLAFTILTNSDNDFRRDVAELISKHLSLVGFRVQTEAVSWEQLQSENMQKHKFDAILTGYYLDYVPDLRFAFHSSQIGKGKNNFYRYQNPELDSLLDTAATAYKEKDKKKAYQKIQEHLVGELPVISLYFRTGSLLVNNRVHGVDKVRELNLYNNIKDWYLVNEK
ncbi:ABC transporter substrate-binding protein [Eubacteriales bacterium mix99]